MSATRSAKSEIDPVSTEDSQPVFDEQMLLEMLGGSRELACEIAASAMADMPDYLDQLERAIAAENWVEAHHVAHTMKGLSAQIAGCRLSQHLKDLVTQLKADGRPELAAVSGVLREEYRQLELAVRCWMG